jgi:DNA repair exonuclease SbcCD ATPase subunit
LSEQEEPRIRCINCGKYAPAMKYCIYCGAKMPATTLPVVKPPQPSVPQSIPPAVPPTVPPPSRAAPQQPFVGGMKDEIIGLMSGVSALYVRKASLLELFQSGQVSERVFLKLYGEYSSKLADFLGARGTKLEELKGKLEERDKRLSEVSSGLEELEVRHKVGEIDTNLYNNRVNAMKAEERELVDSSKALRVNIVGLENLLADKKPGEIRDLEAKLKDSLAALTKMVEEGKATDKTLKAIKPDIDEAVKLLDSLIKEQKGKDKQLREQLETLQTRYKLSELSIEEYERRKRELQAEIDSLWT